MYNYVHFFLELFRAYSTADVEILDVDSLLDEIICCVGDLLLIEIGDLHLESFSLLAFVVGIRIFLSIALFDDATCDDVSCVSGEDVAMCTFPAEAAAAAAMFAPDIPAIRP